jgi:hypothetical protein
MEPLPIISSSDLRSSYEVIGYATFLYINKKNKNGETFRVMYGYYLVFTQKGEEVHCSYDIGPNSRVRLISYIDKVLQMMDESVKVSKISFSKKRKLVCDACLESIKEECYLIQTSLTSKYVHLACKQQYLCKPSIQIVVHDWDEEGFDPKIFRKSFCKMHFISGHCFFKDSKELLPGNLVTISRLLEPSDFVFIEKSKSMEAVIKIVTAKFEPTEDMFIRSVDLESLYTTVNNEVKSLKLGEIHNFATLKMKYRARLLADVFQRFRLFSRRRGIEPMNCRLLIGYSFSLVFSRFHGEYVDEVPRPPIIDIFKSGMYLDKGFVFKKEMNIRDDPGFILCLNMENIYYWVGSQTLPFEDFEFSDTKLDDILVHPNDSNIGFIIDLEIEYSENFDFILTGQSKNQGWTRMCLHYRLLKLLVEQGLILGTVYHIIQFTQTPFLANSYKKTFIRYDNQFDSEINAMANSTMFDGLVNSYCNRTFTDCKLLDVKKTPFDNYLIPSRFAFCQLSMFLKYDFWYNFLKKKYGEKTKMLFSYGNILLVHISTENIYRDLFFDNEWFDFDNHPIFKEGVIDSLERPLRFSDQMKKIKDEMNGDYIFGYKIGNYLEILTSNPDDRIRKYSAM